MDEDIRTYLDASRYREAFELLLDRYQHKAFRLAYSMLGNEASAEEMVQDTRRTTSFATTLRSFSASAS